MTSATTVEDVPPDRKVARLSRWQFRSMSEGLAGNQNSLGVIRLVLATAVIFSHAFYVGGWHHDPFLDLVKGQESIGGIAVLGFFAISGYLITKSGMNSDPLQFIWRRIVRIYPAYLTVLLVAAVVVGPVVWLMLNRPVAGYFTAEPGGPLFYFLNNWDLTVRQMGIFDIFANSPFGVTAGSVMNGSLWTLGYEWGCYLLIFALVIFGVLKRARFFVPVLIFVYLGMAIVPVLVPELSGLVADVYWLRLPLIFLYGAFLAVYSRKVPVDYRLAILALALVVASLVFGRFFFIGYPALAYLVLWLATALPKWLHWIGAKSDYSYGMYVYGFLVQQFTAFLGWYHWGYWPWTLACVVLTAGFAWLSWHGVEKWALKLKDKGPGRGISYWWSSARRLICRRRSSPVATPE